MIVGGFWWLGVAAGAVLCLALGPTFGMAVFLGNAAFAVLCALVHVGRTAAATPPDTENAPEASDTSLQAPHGAILTAAEVAELLQPECNMDGDPAWRVLASHEALRTENAALTARLAEAEQRTERVTQHAVAVLMGRCEVPDHHGPPTWEAFLAGGGTACPLCLTARLVAVEAERDAALARLTRTQAEIAEYIHRCCAERTGAQKFCESYGCSTLSLLGALLRGEEPTDGR